jgi:hypothetical protein
LFSIKDTTPLMKKLLFLLPIFLCVITTASAQRKVSFSAEEKAFLNTMEDTLALLAFVIVNDSIEENRFTACRAMIPKLVSTLKTRNSFHHPFERLKSVSIQYPRDSSFRIFTWQLYVDTDEYRYYGAIQMNTPDLKLIPLVDRSLNINRPEREKLDASNWYGSVYYNIKEVKSKGEKYYTLFGFDAYSFYRKRKIIDVLKFTEKGEAQFGAPVFVHGENKTKNRVVREYSAEVSTRCNYDDVLKMIIFDHLIMLNGNYGEGPTNYPDGSYEGYELKKGLWVHKEKVFDQVSDEAPRPTPILDERTKDIFGN